MQGHQLLSPQSIFDKLRKRKKTESISVEGIPLVVFPNVYPPDQFRSTYIALNFLKDCVNNKSVCDMGCGTGMVGLYCLKHGATHVVQADINPYAVKNAEENRRLHKHSENILEIYESDVFQHIPLQQFDYIVFLMPYHDTPITIKHPLQRAFFDPDFKSIERFLETAKRYCHCHTQIVISFSDKGNTHRLEDLFETSEFAWEIPLTAHQEDPHDVRIYVLRPKSASLTDGHHAKLALNA